ncbi:amino acid ABC transporter permease [Shinella pollutisoli]|uniref:Amino acid ABC transporter permease n=1 Tax=Shinella pollutisoli TaxID=2250594 RepID=A0ABV7DGQ5_9HYPH|nr:amino acid ABC transporter permease [Shinella pollutisoli]
MYADTVDGMKLTRNGWFLASLLVLIALAAFYLDVTPRFASELGLELPPAVLRAVCAVLVALIVVANIFAIASLPRNAQVGIIWAELTVLFFAFFYLFDLSFAFIVSKLGFLLFQGVTTTLYVSAVSIVIATLLALAGAIAKLSRSGVAYGIASFYTSVFRGLPLLMQVYLIYVGLPQLGYNVDAVPAGIAALSLCYGAYMTEIFRAGIQSIPRGQWEASRALGFKPATILRRIILPQAVPIVTPPIGNQFIAMLKDSSLVSIIGVWDLMYLSRTLGNQTFQHMEMLITAAVIYWVLTIVLEIAQSRLERYFRKETR